jgi:hypothetical protein
MLSRNGREIPIARENPSRDSGISWDRNYRPFFDFAHSPIINFFRRFFRRLLYGE